ncbi:MAG TPA: TIGR04255 family protein [Thermodesulfobacteriota bacterium]|nr:TIGR04255 family protein [Thermodesulfobacteriota bacterium]
MPRYKSNYLTEVILRIDFQTSIPEFQRSISKDLEDQISNHFTLKEPKKAVMEQIKLVPSSEKVEREKVEFTEWNYFANERQKRLCLTKDLLLIVYQKYLSYEDFTQPFFTVLRFLALNHKDVQIKRIGMRYINNVKIEEPDPFEWEKYLNNDLLCIFNIPEAMTQIRRAIHILELNTDDAMLKFQYGMHNPDYPAPIKQKIFVLDLDAFKEGTLSFEEVNDIIPKLHQNIESLFEKAITPSLRGRMNQ